MTLVKSKDLLVWIDCEMTGLDHLSDQILSVSCVITSHDLKPLDSGSDTNDVGYHATVSTPESTLSAMGPWCLETHKRTGLYDACLTSTKTADIAAEELLGYIKQHVPEARTALLAGNSVHVDKLFLMQHPWKPVIEWLHYRILDVSAIKEGVRRWCSEDVLHKAPKKNLAHSAKEDVWESIEEARYYMKLFTTMQV